MAQSQGGSVSGHASSGRRFEAALPLKVLAGMSGCWLGVNHCSSTLSHRLGVELLATWLFQDNVHKDYCIRGDSVNSAQLKAGCQSHAGLFWGCDRHSVKPIPFGLRVFFFNVCILKFPSEHFVVWHKQWSTDSVCLLFLFGEGADILQCIYNSYL